MNYDEKYGDISSTNAQPCVLVADILKQMPPDVEPLLADIDFSTADELAEAYSRAWHTVAGDKYLASKDTQRDFPLARIVYKRANSICSAAESVKKLRAAADGMWIRNFEKMEVKKRRNTVFSGEKSAAVYLSAKMEIERIYRFSAIDIECLRYFVCQARKDDPDPALCRSLYMWSAEKMTGKTTVARVVAGVLNGLVTWRDIQRAQIMSDIPTELQFERFARPKGTRYACVVMDEAFTGGKSTAKYYGKFKAALTSDSCQVEVKNGERFDVQCWRNYIFTSNDDISTIVADESERRIFAIEMQRPEQTDYDRLVELWRDYIVNAPEEADTAKWYRDTMPQVKGEVGVTIDDLVSAFTSPDFLSELERYEAECNQRVQAALASGMQAVSVNRYQVSFPRFFSNFITASFDVRKNTNIVKEAVVRAFGEPRSSGNRKYYNVKDLKNALEGDLKENNEQPAADYAQCDEMELPY